MTGHVKSGHVKSIFSFAIISETNGFLSLNGISGHGIYVIILGYCGLSTWRFMLKCPSYITGLSNKPQSLWYIMQKHVEHIDHGM